MRLTESLGRIRTTNALAGFGTRSTAARIRVPAMIEDESVLMHFVKIHVPRIFVRTLSLPMLS